MIHKLETMVGVIGAAVGSTMAIIPSVATMPFYETGFWHSAVAIAGMTVLILTGINLIISISDKFKDDD